MRLTESNAWSGEFGGHQSDRRDPSATRGGQHRVCALQPLNSTFPRLVCSRPTSRPCRRTPRPSHAATLQPSPDMRFFSLFALLALLACARAYEGLGTAYSGEQAAHAPLQHPAGQPQDRLATGLLGLARSPQLAHLVCNRARSDRRTVHRSCRWHSKGARRRPCGASVARPAAPHSRPCCRPHPQAPVTRTRLARTPAASAAWVLISRCAGLCSCGAGKIPCATSARLPARPPACHAASDPPPCPPPHPAHPPLPLCCRPTTAP